MSMDEIADNFTLSEDEKFCKCDKCSKKFSTDFMGDIREHFLSHKKDEEVTA